MFDPHKSAAEMTAAELMAAHVAMSDAEMTGDAIATRVVAIYDALNRRMNKDTDYVVDQPESQCD